jgi:histidinol dehydrogenase
LVKEIFKFKKDISQRTHRDPNNKSSETEINEAIAAVSPELKEAILLAKSNITKFHAQKNKSS